MLQANVKNTLLDVQTQYQVGIVLVDLANQVPNAIHHIVILIKRVVNSIVQLT